ncbi:hypothetical protein B0H10DRAFT_1959280 [Mycena sp. CBHHK59/15]|nr:hypothetical protein B0H10DRAFT_1959280 [Mycena sp. CBHHK59/15]
MSSQMSVSTSQTTNDVLPKWPLYRHYCHKEQLYTVFSRSPDIVLNTPRPEEALPVDLSTTSSTTNPFLRQPRYLSLCHPYLMFIPKHYAWREKLFKVLNHPCHKLLIINDGDDGFCLHPDVAETWLEFEICLRAVGREMLSLAPPKMLPRLMNPWFFSSRLKFLHHFRNDTAWLFWATCQWGFGAWSVGRMPSLLEVPTLQIGAPWSRRRPESIQCSSTMWRNQWSAIWNKEHVGALYHIQAPTDVHHSERDGHREIKWLLETITYSNAPFPIYLSWGKLLRQISSFNVPKAFQGLHADNTKWGGVLSRACVFIWEEQDGHYIFQPGGRGSYSQLWSEYPGPQHRFDPISNEWDLCELFEDNNPVFGGFYKVPSDYSDDMDNHLTLPQNIGMASRLPWGDDRMEVVQMQHPDDLEMYDSPWDEDLGPDLTESEVPKRNLTEASKKCVNLVYLKFGFAPPRMEKPDYESSTGSLLGTLKMRFGFVMPPSPETFAARDLPQVCLNLQLLANVISMTDIGRQLASEKGLANILGIFFGQCMEARYVNHINRLLLDYHQPQRFSRGPALFIVGQEHLKTMHNPSQEGCYYVLLRQGWGPDIKDVVRHFLVQGIPFWLAYVRAKIMPVEETPSPFTAHRPKGFKADTSSGLGFHPKKYKFDEHNYNMYTTERDLRFLHTPRSRIALQYGSQKKRAGKGNGKQGHGRANQIKLALTRLVSSHGGPNQKPLNHFQKDVYMLQCQSDWRHNLKFCKDVKTCCDGGDVQSGKARLQPRQSTQCGQEQAI